MGKIMDLRSSRGRVSWAESVARAIYAETENCENWQNEKNLSSAYAAWFRNSLFYLI